MGLSKSAVDKAITAALRAYRQASPETEQAFSAFEQACKTTPILQNVPEPVRKALLIAEARALTHIAEVAKDRALRNRRNL